LLDLGLALEIFGLALEIFQADNRLGGRGRPSRHTTHQPGCGDVPK
jgi:hypothetical protein